MVCCPGFRRDAAGGSPGLSVEGRSGASPSPSCSSEAGLMATGALPRSSGLSPRRSQPRSSADSGCHDGIVRGPERQGEQRAEQFLTRTHAGAASSAVREDTPFSYQLLFCLWGGDTESRGGAGNCLVRDRADARLWPSRRRRIHTEGSQPLPFRCPLPARPEGRLSVVSRG